MKYIVIECHPAYAIVSDENGRFIRVANFHYKVGDTVSNVVEMNMPADASPKKRKFGWIYAVAAACLILAMLPAFILPNVMYASVYMKINPEVRIDVNRKDIVVGLSGVNDDGIVLINGYSFKNKDVDTVVDELVIRAIDMEYLKDGGTVAISLDGDDDEWVNNTGGKIDQKLCDKLSDKMSVNVEVKNKKNDQSVKHHGGSGNNGDMHKDEHEDPDDDDDDDDYLDLDYDQSNLVTPDESSKPQKPNGGENSGFGGQYGKPESPECMNPDCDDEDCDGCGGWDEPPREHPECMNPDCDDEDCDGCDDWDDWHEAPHKDQRCMNPNCYDPECKGCDPEQYPSDFSGEQPSGPSGNGYGAHNYEYPRQPNSHIHDEESETELQHPHPNPPVEAPIPQQ